MLELLGGALLALAASWFVQTRIVPQSNRRQKRDDRWMNDLLALDELLARRLPDLLDRAELTTSYMKILPPVEEWNDGIETLAQRWEQERREASRDLEAAVEEAQWLTRGIVRVAPTALVHLNLEISVRRIDIDATHARFTPDDAEEAELEARYKRARETAKLSQVLCELLLDGGTPPRARLSPRARIKAALARRRRPRPRPTKQDPKSEPDAAPAP